MVWKRSSHRLVLNSCGVCFSEAGLNCWNVPACPVSPLSAAPRLLLAVRQREGHPGTTTGPHRPQGGAYGETYCRSTVTVSVWRNCLSVVKVSRESCQISQAVTSLAPRGYFLNLPAHADHSCSCPATLPHVLTTYDLLRSSLQKTHSCHLRRRWKQEVKVWRRTSR